MSLIRAFVDESSSDRADGRQAYLIGAALVPMTQLDEVRDGLLPLLRPGQKKVHWTDESAQGRVKILDALAQLGPMTALVTHIGWAARRTERARRKCLELLYAELCQMGVERATLESRSRAQDQRDVAHIVGLQNGVLPRRLQVEHVRGEHEPLLWIADVLLGAVNSASRGESMYLEALRETIVFESITSDSLE